MTRQTPSVIESSEMRDWDDAVAFACSLPEVGMASFYGKPCPKLNGKALVSPGHEPGSCALFVASIAEKQMLIETDPETFWETPHYAAYPMVLARYGTPARERIELYIRRRWWDLAKKAQRATIGERP
jgi:hypothetical protein